MAETRPWTGGERLLVAISVVGLVAVGLFAWHLADRDVDTSGECPPVEAALKKLGHAGRERERAGAWIDDAIRGHFCANPDATEDSTRALLGRVRTAVARADRRASSGFDFWRPSPPVQTELPDPPSTRSGSPADRALSYVLASQNVFAPWVVAFGKDRLLVGAASGSLTPGHRYQLWLRSAGRWRMLPVGPACGNPSVVWLDPASAAVATSCADAPDEAVDIYDLLHPGPAVERVEHVGGPSATEENALEFERPYDPAHVEATEGSLRYQWRIARENGKLVSHVKLLNEDRKVLYDLLGAPEDERLRATGNPDGAAVLGRLRRGSIGGGQDDADPRGPRRTRFVWHCDELCRGEGGCTITLEHGDSGLHVLFEDLPPGCVPADLVRTPDPSRVVAPRNGRVLAISLAEPVGLLAVGEDWLANVNGVLQRIPGKGGRFQVLASRPRNDDCSCDGSRRLVLGGPETSTAVAIASLELVARPLGGGPETVLEHLDETLAGLAADESNAYALTTGELRKIPLTGGAGVLVTDALHLAAAVEVADGALWVLDQDADFAKTEIVRIPIAGGVPQRFPTGGDTPRPMLAADAHALYWADDVGRLHRFDLATHADQVLYESGQTLSALALGDEDVFVAVDAGTDTRLVRISKNAGKAVVLATGQPGVCALAVHGETLAWEGGGTLAAAPWAGPPITVSPGLVAATHAE